MSDTSQAEAFFATVRQVLKTGYYPGNCPDLRAKAQKLFASLLEAAEPGDPEVWFALGHGFSHGWGAELDLDAGEKWFRRAAEAGHSDAMVSLGIRLQQPARIADSAEAIEWFQRAAATGNSFGMSRLGFAYREGRGVPENYETAAEWFIRAYEAGDKHSAVHAGRLFSVWLSRPEEAIRWYRLAAEAGQKEAYVSLARPYSKRPMNGAKHNGERTFQSADPEGM